MVLIVGAAIAEEPAFDEEFIPSLGTHSGSSKPYGGVIELDRRTYVTYIQSAFGT